MLTQYSVRTNYHDVVLVTQSGRSGREGSHSSGGGRHGTAAVTSSSRRQHVDGVLFISLVSTGLCVFVFVMCWCWLDLSSCRLCFFFVLLAVGWRSDGGWILSSLPNEEKKKLRERKRARHVICEQCDMDLSHLSVLVHVFSMQYHEATHFAGGCQRKLSDLGWWCVSSRGCARRWTMAVSLSR